MPRIAYIEKNFTPASRAIIDTANQIIADYETQGFNLTLRQLYYQFVSRDLIPNSQREYNRLGGIINDARLAGLIDWNSITDRTRFLRALAHWDKPSDIVRGAAEQFRVDKWATQEYRPEVWIEKDALVGVIEGICQENDVPFLSCRGYTSQSEMWGAAQRLIRYVEKGQLPVILHLGDHDPSGKDMTRDIIDRLQMFVGSDIEVNRLALNMSQIEKFNPPPNPAKVTDSRSTAYIAEFGNSSWELDALDPNTIAGVIRNAIQAVRDDKKWEAAVKLEKKGRAQISGVAKKL
jgi:hypothetical protein